MKRHCNNLICVKCADDLEYVRTNFTNKTRILTHCQNCGKPITKTLNKIIGWHFDDIFCRACGTKRAAFEKYGVVNVFQLESVKEKATETLFKHYAVTNASKSNIIQNRIKQTCLKNYGVDVPAKSVQVIEKMKNTRYTKNFGKFRSSDEIEKMQNTCLEKYGMKACWNRSDVKEQQEKTFLEKYGSKCYLHTNAYKEKMIELHGADNPNYCEDIEVNRFRKYYYDGTNFDSSWELAYYIWLKDHNIQFSFHRSLTYFEYEYACKIHRYYPDFILDDKIVEIKSPYLLRLMQTKGTIDEAKYNCMKSHNVVIISDCQKYVNYVENKYGKDFLTNCRRTDGSS